MTSASQRASTVSVILSGRMRIAVLDDYHHVAAEAADWRSLSAEVAFFDVPIPHDALASTLHGFDVLVLMRERTRFPRELLAQLPSLKLLVTTGMRNAAVDVAYLSSERPEVTVCGTGMLGYGGAAEEPPGLNSTVELAWALILALYKRVTHENQAIRQGIWQQGLPTNLRGQTLGLLGLGRLGAQMVPVARAFGMNVVAWSQNLTSERAAEAGAAHVAKDELFGSSDVISVHLVLSQRTRGLVGPVELAAMKSTAFLVNTSRGPIVQERALIDALKGGQIAAAGLDVYDQEPIPADHELLSLENTVLLPHLGYVSREALLVMYRQVVEDIAAYQAGDPIRVIS